MSQILEESETWLTFQMSSIQRDAEQSFGKQLSPECFSENIVRLKGRLIGWNCLH
jgi:hypothetical protein